MSSKKSDKKSDKKRPTSTRASKEPSLKPKGSGGNGKPSTTRAKKSTGNTPSAKRSSGTSFFPSDGASMKMMEKAVHDQELEIKKLKRENQVMASQLKKMQNQQGKKNKNIEKEKTMRVAANQERHWLKQKLSRMQLAIEARLKMLGIDFSNCNDLSEALEAAFAAIQKLAAELAKKEQELQEMQSERDGMMEDQENMQKAMDKLNNKIKKQQRAMDEQKKQIDDRDRRLSLMGNEKKKEKGKVGEYEKEMENLRAEIEKLKAAKEKQFDDFVDKKADMDAAMRKQKREMDKLKKQLEDAAAAQNDLKEQNEKLLSDLSKKQGLIDKLEDKLMDAKEKLKESEENHKKQMEEMEDRLKKANDDNDELRKRLAEMEEKMRKMQDTIDEQNKEKDDLRNQLEAEKKKNEQAKKDAKEASADNDAEKAKMEEQRKKLLNQMKEQEKEMKAQADEIADLKKQLADALKKLKESENDGNDKDNKLADMRSELEKLKKMLEDKNKDGEDKDDEIARLLAELEKMKKALKDANQKIDDYMNRPRDDKEVQTDLTGQWFRDTNMKLAEIDDIKADNARLQELAHKNDARLEELADENRGLLDEIDALLKQQAQFRPDSSNHRGEILAMCTSPNKLIVATTATDKTVRLWRCLPDEKSSKQVQVYACARMDGNALSLAFTRDGSYLVAGCAYKNGPDGLLMIWDMTKGDGEVAFLFRSRPSIRFGRAHCVCWSPNSQYIYSGDTTGSIWVWDTPRQILLAEVGAHKDVVHDIEMQGDFLFSCSLDQTVSSFDSKLLAKVKVKKNKIHVHKPKVFKAIQQDKNDKYPYQKISVTTDGKYIVAGSRKIMVWTFDGTKFGKGPRITDNDLDFIKMLHVRNDKVIICRLRTNRAKIFDIKTGKEFKVAKYKSTICQVGICHNSQYAVCCLQDVEKKKAKDCKMVLWKLQ